MSPWRLLDFRWSSSRMPLDKSLIRRQTGTLLSRRCVRIWRNTDARTPRHGTVTAGDKGITSDFGEEPGEILPCARGNGR
jgi:hypothetical protein